MRRRALRALGVVAVAIALVPMSALAESGARLPGAESALQVANLLRQADRLEQADVPDGFEDEVMPLARCRERRCDADAHVVGFSMDAGVDESLDAVRRQLAAKGWDEVPSGVDGCSTFAKSNGRYRWAFVQCVPMGGWTSVVIRYELGEGDNGREGR